MIPQSNYEHKTPLTILAADAGSGSFSAALMHGGEVYETTVVKTGKENGLFFESIDDLFKKCRMDFSSVSAAALTIGPGSFTALRNLAVYFKTAAYFLKIPLYAYSTLDILNRQNQTENLCAYILDGGRNFYFGAFYFNGKRITDDLDIKKQTFHEIITNPKKRTSFFCESTDANLTDQIKGYLTEGSSGVTISGSAAEEYRDTFQPENITIHNPKQCFVKARHIAEAAQTDYIQKNKQHTVDPLTLNPVYLRKPYAAKPVAKKQQKQV